MDDGRAARRTEGGRPSRPQSTATAVAIPARDPDGQPPDEIDVLFPAPRPGDTVRRTRRADGRQERLLERPLLLGAVSIAVVGLAAVIAWQVWPQSPGPVAERPRPVAAPVSPGARPPVTGGLAGRAAGPLPGAAHATRAPAADVDPSRSPAPPGTAPSAATGAASPASPSAGTVPSAVGSPPATPGPSSSPGATATGPRTLRAGDSGAEVTDLQRLLFAQGFTYVSPTGVYDDSTVRGVTQAQRDRGLSCDPAGVYGPCTRAALTS